MGGLGSAGKICGKMGGEVFSGMRASAGPESRLVQVRQVHRIVLERRSHSSKPEGAPSVVKAVRVGEADISPGGAILRMARLHPEDVLWDSGLDSDRQSTHAAGCTREGGSVDPEGGEG